MRLGVDDLTFDLLSLGALIRDLGQRHGIRLAEQPVRLRLARAREPQQPRIDRRLREWAGVELAGREIVAEA